MGTASAFVLSPLSGDANLDGKVDINDLTVVLSHYGQSGMTWATGDFDGDGQVDINDLTIVLSGYNQSIGAGAATFRPCPSPPTGAASCRRIRPAGSLAEVQELGVASRRRGV